MQRDVIVCVKALYGVKTTTGNQDDVLESSEY